MRMTSYLDDNGDKKVTANMNWKQMMFTTVGTFLTVLSVYTVMYIVFDFGGGMLSNSA
jgi:hypothetical protein